ncbi:MAG: hypothetical protein ACYC99_05360 [Candidatus Geothermincolia bacterium]
MRDSESYSRREPKKQANFLLPEPVLTELRRLVPAKMRSQVVTTALERELARIKARKALADYFGAWKPAAGKA